MTELVPWHQLTSFELNQETQKNVQNELSWLLHDTRNQLRSVLVGLEECQLALRSSNDNEDNKDKNSSTHTNNYHNNSSILQGPFKLAVSSGKLDVMKGLLVRSGTSLLDFDIKIHLSASSSSPAFLSASSSSPTVIDGPGVQGVLSNHSSLASSFQHWSFRHNALTAATNTMSNNGHSISGGVSSSNLVLSQRDTDKYKYNPGNANKSPYSPFQVNMKSSATPLPLKQLVGAVNYLAEAVACINKNNNLQQEQGKNHIPKKDNDENHDEESVKDMALKLSQLYQLVQAATDSLKGPGQPFYVPKPMMEHGLASSNIPSPALSGISTPKDNLKQKTTTTLINTNTPNVNHDTVKGHSNTDGHNGVKVLKNPSTSDLSHKPHQPFKAANLPEAVATEYATNPAFMAHDMPDNTIVSFYVSDGSIVTEVRVLEPLEHPPATNGTGNGHGNGNGISFGFGTGTSGDDHSPFSWFKTKKSHQHEDKHESQHQNAKQNEGHAEKEVEKYKSPISLYPDLQKIIELETLIANNGPGFYPKLLQGRKIKDYVRVESQDPNLIMATTKLRALVYHVASLKKRVDLLVGNM